MASSERKTSNNKPTSTENSGSIKVPVNEDYLFDVDVKNRELAPAYWLGPVYDVRRGSWFYQEGSTLRPCEENLATQLEEGYLKVKPWRFESESNKATLSKVKPKASIPGQDPAIHHGEEDMSKDKTQFSDSIKTQTKSDSDKQVGNASDNLQSQTYRLFGAYMNSVVTYQDASTAWLLTDDFLSRMSSTVYQRISGNLGGTKILRGFFESAKGKDKKKDSNEESNVPKSSSNVSNIKPQALSESADDENQRFTYVEQQQKQEVDQDEDSEPRLLKLERQMSSLVSLPDLNDPAKQDEELRKRDEHEIREDYRDADGEDQDREIEHLILVTHGIGQRLGLRLESINFIHDVNVFRKTIKNVYTLSPDLQALNNEIDKLPKNCRIQVLPVVWRHLLDFPNQRFKDDRREQDLTDADANENEERYPSLDDITVDGVPAIRNLITDLALDILLYQSAYKEHIARIVQRECNRVYRLFLQRNPTFKGKISLVGHSLGSAILFDILCRQKEDHHDDSTLKRRGRSRVSSSAGQENSQDLNLEFEVEGFFCLGSPLGLYQMLKGCKIVARNSDGLIEHTAMDDPFLGASSMQIDSSIKRQSELLSITISSPKCNQLFNVFHPADPISYRIEPLISPDMSSLKPQPLPYTKKGIFSAPGQGFTGIGARVGQSVSGFWSNITSGVASSLLNRSLGLTGDGQISSTRSSNTPQNFNHSSSSPGAGTNITGGGVVTTSTEADTVKSGPTEMSSESRSSGEHPPTLIDAEIETLYTGFQKRQKSHQSEGVRDLGINAEWQEADARARRLRREEEKVRALNSNGRVDYSIQE